MAAKLKFLVPMLLLFGAGCSAPWSSGSSRPTQSARSTVIPPTNAVTVTPPTPASTSAPTIISTIPAPQPTPTIAPTPTAVPTPSVLTAPVSNCCGVFAWFDNRHLLVFDNLASGKSGSYLIDVFTGTRTFMSTVFGLPSSSGLIAFPDASRGVTDVRRADGSLVATIKNGGVLSWISPDGKRVAWLRDLGVPNTSSLVNRLVELTVADIDGTSTRSLLEFEAASVSWTSDSRHLVALGRAPGGTQSGVWLIDANDGTNSVVVPATFVRALNVSPDGRRMTYLVTFSGDRSQDGAWAADVSGANPLHLKEVGALRWAGDDNHLWLLDLAPSGGGEDHVQRLDAASDTAGQRVGLGGRVLNDQWQVSPDGRLVAFWNEAEGSVLVRPLSP